MVCHLPGCWTTDRVTDHLSRDFVSTYWPNPDTPGSKVRNMYDRIAAADTSAANGGTADAGAAKTNGQPNGIAVKQE